MINNVVLIGRLTKDPEIKIVGDKKVANFTLAVQRNREEADFINVETWNRTADSVDQYVTKGSLVGVSGSLRTGTYETSDGSRRSFAKVIANEVSFIILKKEDEEE